MWYRMSLSQIEVYFSNGSLRVDMIWVYIVHGVGGRCSLLKVSRRFIAPPAMLRQVLLGMICIQLGVSCHDRDAQQVRSSEGGQKPGKGMIECRGKGEYVSNY